MRIDVKLDRLLVERGVRSNELAQRIGISENNLSRIKTGKIKAIRFSTLMALCHELDCQPGDIMEFVEGDSDR